jgi:hypothetical protein
MISCVSVSQTGVIADCECCKFNPKRSSNVRSDRMAFHIFVPGNLRVRTTAATLFYFKGDVNFLANNDGFEKNLDSSCHI